MNHVTALPALQARIALPRPKGWTAPPYGTREYWAAYADGWITEEQAENESALNQQRRSTARAALGTRSPEPARWSNPEPRQSQQYAQDMATTAARDRRVCDGAKSCLQIIRARCGSGRATSTCKTTLANIMGRSARTVQRYLRDLEEYGYIETMTRRGPSGLYTGLVITITEKVLPIYKAAAWLANWLAGMSGSTRSPETRVFSDRTDLSPKNLSPKNPSFYGLDAPPLRDRMVALLT